MFRYARVFPPPRRAEHPTSGRTYPRMVLLVLTRNSRIMCSGSPVKFRSEQIYSPFVFVLTLEVSFV